MASPEFIIKLIAWFAHPPLIDRGENLLWNYYNYIEKSLFMVLGNFK